MRKLGIRNMAEAVLKVNADISGFDSKIRRAQRGLQDFVKSGGTGGQMLKGFSEGLGINMKMLSPYGAALEAAKVAMKVFSDALGANEQVMDKWKGALEGAKSTYKSFLKSISNSSTVKDAWNNMKNTFASGQAAYNAEDNLGTFNAFNQNNLQRSSTRLTEAEAAYRTGNGSRSDVQAAAEAYKKDLEDRRKFEMEAYIKKIEDFATVNSIGFEEAKKVFEGSWDNLVAVKEGMGPLAEAFNLISDEEMNAIQQIGKRAEDTAQEIAAIDKRVARVLGKKQEEEKPQWEKVDALAVPQTEQLVPDLAAANTQIQQTGQALNDAFMVGSLPDLQDQLDELRNKLGSLTAGTEEWHETMEQIVSTQGQINKMQARINAGGDAAEDVAKGNGDAWQYAAQAVANVGSALGQIEDPSAKVAGIVMQAVANIALGFAQATASQATGAAGVFGWIAAATAGLATMVATIASIKSVTSGYAEGGIVRGAPNGGYDSVPAMLSPGEVVLNAAQQRNVAASLEGSNPMANLRLSTEIRGENLRVVLQNNNTRRGGSRTKYRI